MQDASYRNLEPTYYQATANAAPVLDKLRQDIAVDCCVIGAGFSGLSTALELAKAGQTVAIVEAAQVGFGASGRNGGEVLIGYSCGMPALIKQVGLTAAKHLWQLSLDAVELLDQRVRDYQINCHWQRGYVQPARTPAQLIDLFNQQQLLKRYFDFNQYDLWDIEQTRAHIQSAYYIGALVDPRSGYLQPLNYCLGLADAALAAGAMIYQHSPVQDLTQQQDHWLVSTDHACIQAKHVVIATNAYTGTIKNHYFKQLFKKLVIVRSNIAVSEPLGDLATQLLSANFCVSDRNHLVDYFHITADQRLLFGGESNYWSSHPKWVEKTLRHKISQVFPQLSCLQFDYSWSGYIDCTVNQAPHFGALAKNLYFMQGYSGHGVALAGLAGQAVAEAILGDRRKLDHFGALKHLSIPAPAWMKHIAGQLALHTWAIRDKLS